MARTTSFAGATLLLLAACTTPRTQIMVTTDTDLAIPSEIDGIVFEVTGPEGTMVTATADLTALPAFLGVYHDSGPLEPVVVRVVGQLGAVDVVERRAQLAFQPERTVVLSMNLLASCVTTMCGAGQTCTETGCRSSLVDASGLEDWTGVPPGIDGGGPTDSAMDAPVDSSPDAPVDTGGDVAVDTAADVPVDTTPPCDMTPTGECTDFARDPLNCGSMGTTCMAAEVCTASTCTCRPGLTDDGAGGCVDLQTDPANCGMLGEVCAGVCREGACASSCGPLDDCGGACTIGDDVLHCGACDNACSVTEVCSRGACRGFTIGLGCTTCPCPACPVGNTCCAYPGAGAIVCVDGPACP